ncbi:MAG: hypothetical protein ABI977_16020 [Acidobacteriota bacterium]
MSDNEKSQPAFYSPRPYLSWSQINLFERSPDLYARKYLFAQEEQQSEAQRLGKKLASALELQQKTGDDALDSVVSIFPEYPNREVKMEAVLDGVDVPLYGVLDGYDPLKLRIGEYKSGRLWTQEMVNESGQLKMYSLLVWLNSRQLPSEIMLHWARTQYIEVKGVELTGEMQSFEAKFSLEDMLTFSARVRTVWDGIKKLSKLHFQGIR